jgi:DNA-binding NtrC family response regulator
LQWFVGRLNGRRVLIADSDAAVRQHLFSALLAVDVFSDCVSSVPDALARIGEESYGVVMIDIGLPGGNPELVIGAIARQPVGVRPVVLVVAANPALARSLDVDVVQIVLRKPLALRQTVDVIRSCVENSLTRVELGDGDGDLSQPIS